ncbi:hypothetical protein [Dissulfurimicrobium hydrothermale]|uniref:hypothetical protein n=1 Tax=Dissulfurimicrobium hydrothermale TaxID=1750598 RepID=UPI001EDC1091|nr:hypothetical protein [Dissulfurimicrobium hydrothermale]UKL13634.1 hypothetical protein LGS26_09240 [Dissulfurimicrobium hydrothermale]
MFVIKLIRRLVRRVFHPGVFLRDRYRAFKSLLESDKEAHAVIAGLQELVYGKDAASNEAVQGLYKSLRDAVGNMIECLLEMVPGSYLALPWSFKKIDDDIMRHMSGRLSPYHDFKDMMVFIDHLNLLDPSHHSFRPQGCRSMYDIIRFVHEKAIYEMFSTGTDIISGKIKGAKRLISEHPVNLYLLDMDGGLCKGCEGLEEIDISMVCSIPMRALWQGIVYPDIKRSGQMPFDWRSFGEAVSAGGIASRDSPTFASYAAISADYMNISIKFGYHFVVVDALCGEDLDQNYIMFSFTGGGGDFRGRTLRVAFLAGVLNGLDFDVRTKKDVINARIDRLGRLEIEGRLDILGRLLAVTRLMDMDIKDEATVERWVAEFMAGRYDFRYDGPGGFQV